jgi:hypothetical protein
LSNKFIREVVNQDVNHLAKATLPIRVGSSGLAEAKSTIFMRGYQELSGVDRSLQLSSRENEAGCLLICEEGESAATSSPGQRGIPAKIVVDITEMPAAGRVSFVQHESRQFVFSDDVTGIKEGGYVLLRNEDIVLGVDKYIVLP